MSNKSNKDNVIELEQPSTISKAAPSVHKWSHIPISREIIQDSQIPIDARMLLIYLISFKEGWTFYDAKIRKDLCIGFTKLKLLFKQLRELGYVKTVPIMGEDGRMVGSKRLFSSLPEFDKKPREAANATESMENRQSVDPTVRKSEAKITNSIIKDDINNINNKKINKKSFDKEFDEFWEKYPKKVDKHKTSIIYQGLLSKKDNVSHEFIMLALCGQVKEREINRELGIWQEPPKNPPTWLNGRCWDNPFKTEDEIREDYERNQKHGRCQQNGHRQDAGGRSKLEARNSLVQSFADQAANEARRIFSGEDDSDTEC